MQGQKPGSDTQYSKGIKKDHTTGVPIKIPTRDSHDVPGNTTGSSPTTTGSPEPTFGSPGTTTGTPGTTTGAGDNNLSGNNPPDFPTYVNKNALIDSQVRGTYTLTDGSGKKEFYGTYDFSSKLSDFKTFGLSLTLLIFSIYLFHVSTKIYRQYFDKKAKENYFTPIFYMCALIFNYIWIVIVMTKKGLPMSLTPHEFLLFPNQFVLGVMLSSLLLFTVGIFRFTLIAFIPNSDDNAKTLKDSRFSFIGIVFGLLSALANLVTIWLAFK